MEVNFSDKNFNATEILKSYAQDRVQRLARRFEKLEKAEVKFVLEKNPRVAENCRVELTVLFNGRLMKSVSSTRDMRTSVDEALDKLERQIQKHKEKLVEKPRNRTAAENAESPAEDHGAPRIVRVKTFQLKPMDPEEAATQMELLGHDFFIFVNSETNETSVIYRRRDGNFGLIVPKS